MSANWLPAGFACENPESRFMPAVANPTIDLHPPPDSQFLHRLLYIVLRDCYAYQDENSDALRFGEREARLGRLKQGMRRIANRYGFARRGFTVEHATAALMEVIANRPGFERTYNLLDGTSRILLVELLELRILGAKHVRLSRSNPAYWREYNSIDRRFLQERSVLRTRDWTLNRYRIPRQSGSIDLIAHPLTVLNTYSLDMYSHPDVSVEPGDVVIDAGGCWGDTALCFADRAGPHGRVYTFEFVEENLDVLRRNLALNPGLAERVTVVETALGETTGITLSYSPAGPGTALGSGPCSVDIISIDDFVDEQRLERVDFIKMDIEGAELDALRGAERTLRRLAPKLAISVYHKPLDLAEIPAFLDDLDVGYRFFLDHFTIHSEETVLFARQRG